MNEALQKAYELEKEKLKKKKKKLNENGDPMGTTYSLMENGSVMKIPPGFTSSDLSGITKL